MHHGILHTWPIFTITTRTGVNTQKCVRRKIQHFTPSNTDEYIIHNNNPESWKYNLLRLFKTIYIGNLEQVPVRQNQLIVSFYEKNWFLYFDG